jgi:hypothetical protein
MADIFGDLERLAADLYPYRWPISVGVALTIAAAIVIAIRLGWHERVQRHPRLAAAVVVATLAVAIPVGNYTLSPLWTRTELIEQSPLLVAGAEANAVAGQAAIDAETARVLRTGTFAGADEFHFGQGDAHLIETAPGSYTLRLENFSVRNGPDLFVYLSPNAEGYGDGALNLGELKATDCAFNYEIPPGADLAQFESVIVWCKQFAVLFATAPLADA